MRGDFEVVVACDDGRVRKLGQGFTTYACISFTRDLRPLDVHIGLLKVDGLEASSIIATSSLMVSRGRPFALLLGSLTIAGFNVVSPATVMKLTGSPTLVVYTYRPSFERLRPAFERLPHRELRARILRVVDEARRVLTPRGELWVLAWGIGLDEARNLIVSLQEHSRVPEPIRVAHNVASEASLILNYVLKNLI